MIAPSIYFDTANFDAMLQRYVQYSSRGVADAINKKMGDLMMTAARFANKADRGAIDTLHKMPWWYAFVQKLVKLEGVSETKRRRTRKGEKIGGVAAESGMVRDPYSGALTRKQVGRVSRIVTRRRRAGIAYFKALFISGAEAYGKRASALTVRGNSDGRGGGHRAGESVGIKHNVARGMRTMFASESLPLAMTSLPIRTARKGYWPGGNRLGPQADLDRKVSIADVALAKSAAYQIQDMATYIAGKMIAGAERARSA